MKTFLQIASHVIPLCAVIPLVMNWCKASRILKTRTYLTLDGGDAEGNAAGPSLEEAMELLLNNLRSVGLPIVLILVGFGAQIILMLL